MASKRKSKKRRTESRPQTVPVSQLPEGAREALAIVQSAFAKEPEGLPEGALALVERDSELALRLADSLSLLAGKLHPPVSDHGRRDDAGAEGLKEDRRAVLGAALELAGHVCVLGEGPVRSTVEWIVQQSQRYGESLREAVPPRADWLVVLGLGLFRRCRSLSDRLRVAVAQSPPRSDAAPMSARAQLILRRAQAEEAERISRDAALLQLRAVCSAASRAKDLPLKLQPWEGSEPWPRWTHRFPWQGYAEQWVRDTWVPLAESLTVLEALEGPVDDLLDTPCKEDDQALIRDEFRAVFDARCVEPSIGQATRSVHAVITREGAKPGYLNWEVMHRYFDAMENAIGRRMEAILLGGRQTTLRKKNPHETTGASVGSQPHPQQAARPVRSQVGNEDTVGALERELITTRSFLAGLKLNGTRWITLVEKQGEPVWRAERCAGLHRFGELMSIVRREDADLAQEISSRKVSRSLRRNLKLPDFVPAWGNRATIRPS